MLKTRYCLLYVSVLLLSVVAGCSSEQSSVEGDATGSLDESIRTMNDETLRSFFEPLGPVPIPDTNPMSDEKVELGMMLFADPRLSRNNQLSCLSCHSPSLGYSDNLTFSLGFDRAVVGRNSPSIVNTAYYDHLFWDGRASSLEAQALGPIQDEKEMNQDLDTMVEQVEAVEGYKPHFNRAFDGEITVETIVKAIAAFQRTINIVDTAFDRFIAGDNDALDEREKYGMELYVTKGSCITCHAGPNFTDMAFHNIGINTDDTGRYGVTGIKEDDGKFRTPGLRGVTYTAPYMHNGSLVTLEDVIEYYNRGGDNHPNKSSIIKPLELTEEEKKALTAFIRAISGTPPEIDIPELPQ
ncbi:cytochrome-c peroxidase [Bacillus sp. FJAT-45350]|uniref:cytochrome-c peroxidase n=1 Tax=Bacillus sp. FJAT-45350 TaxID=2011014 RepID=UPI000BB709D3|nr:cytochrome c peroxidase [Bacillus sp. FJAT-45350]